MTLLGYLVDSNKFLPSAFGPYKTNAFVPGSFASDHQGDSYYGALGDTSGNSWTKYNSTVDVAIDKAITDTYVVYTYSNGTYIFQTPQNSKQKEINTRIVEAGAIPWCTRFNFFGKKRVIYQETIGYNYTPAASLGLNTYVTLHRFAESTEVVTDTNDVYDIEGPFSALQDTLLVKGAKTEARLVINGTARTTQASTIYNGTTYSDFLDRIMTIADRHRNPLHTNYRRVRPVSGEGVKLRTTYQQDPKGGFECQSLMSLCADTAARVGELTLEKQCDWPSDDKGKSYPSGHSAQAWTIALYLGQMKPALLEPFMQKAYRFAVNRTIGKFHWNSDCIYGRLIGTLTLPLVNAMSGLSSMYNTLKSTLNGNTPVSEGKVEITYNTGGHSGSGKINIYVDNRSSSTIVVRRVQFTVVGDNPSLQNGVGYIQYLIPTQEQGTIPANTKKILVANTTLAEATGANNCGKVANTFSNGYYNDGNNTGLSDWSWNSLPNVSGMAVNTDLQDGMEYTIVYGDTTVASTAVSSGQSSESGITVTLVNNTSQNIWFQNKLRFLVDTGGDEPVKTDVMNLGSASKFELLAGNSVTFTEIIADSNTTGAHFSSKRTIGKYTYPSNVLLYDEDGSSQSWQIPIPEVKDTTKTYEDNATYTITLGGSITPISGEVTNTVTVANNSANSITFSGQVFYYVYGTTQDGSYTGYIGLIGNCTGDTFTIVSGSSKTYTVKFPVNDNQTPSNALGLPFASSAQLSGTGKTSNAGYIDGGQKVYCNSLSTGDSFRAGGSYTITIGSGVTPVTGDVNTTITIVNNSGSSKTFDGRVCFITYGTKADENYTGYFRIKGTCSGASFTIPAGGSQTYTVLFAKDSKQTPSVALGMTFATQAQRNQFKSNNGYYINGNCYTCNDFSYSDTFREGGNYTMTIPANTHEWSSD